MKGWAVLEEVEVSIVCWENEVEKNWVIVGLECVFVEEDYE